MSTSSFNKPIYDALKSDKFQKRLAQLQKYNDSDTSKLLLFQFSDYVYADAYRTLELNNKNILLHCAEAGNFGDISQTYFFAEKIKKARPDCNISILFQLQTKDKEPFEAVFPVKQYNTHFIPRFAVYNEKEKLLETAFNSGCVIGVAVPIATPHLYKKHHRSLREYGFGTHPDTKDNNLSMGFSLNEEGISIPTIPARQLHDIQSPWLKQALAINSSETQNQYHNKNQLYNLYTRDWTAYIVGINTIAALENKNSKVIDIVSPFQSTLQDLIDWKILDRENLKKQGINKITRITSEGSESISLGDGEGKEMRIVSGAFSKSDLEALQQHSQPFFGCTGDMTYSESVVLNKIPFYDIVSHKESFFKGMKKLAEDLNLESLSSFFNLLSNVVDNETEVYKKNTPRKQGGWWGDPPCYDIANPTSVARKSVNELIPLYTQFANKIADCCSDPKLLHEVTQFNTYIQANCNVEAKLLAMVDRGLILANYPELIEVEKNLWERFQKNEISLESVFIELKNSIQQAVQNQQRNSNKMQM